MAWYWLVVLRVMVIVDSERFFQYHSWLSSKVAWSSDFLGLLVAMGDCRGGRGGDFV